MTLQLLILVSFFSLKDQRIESGACENEGASMILSWSFELSFDFFFAKFGSAVSIHYTGQGVQQIQPKHRASKKKKVASISTSHFLSVSMKSLSSNLDVYTDTS